MLFSILQCSYNLPIMLKFMLKNKICAYSIITIYIQICMSKSLLIEKDCFY